MPGAAAVGDAKVRDPPHPVAQPHGPALPHTTQARGGFQQQAWSPQQKTLGGGSCPGSLPRSGTRHRHGAQAVPHWRGVPCPQSSSTQGGGGPPCEGPTCMGTAGLDSRACRTEGLCTPSLAAAIPWQQGGAEPGQEPLFLLPAMPRGTGRGREGAGPFSSNRKANKSGKLGAINLR